MRLDPSFQTYHLTTNMFDVVFSTYYLTQIMFGPDFQDLSTIMLDRHNLTLFLLGPELQVLNTNMPEFVLNSEHIQFDPDYV